MNSTANALLTQEFYGPLKIIVHTLSGEVYDFTPDFDPKIVGEESTLFDYVGQACACIFTNMTTRLMICTCPAYWQILDFSPEQRRLEVQQIGGEDLTIEEDDYEKLARETLALMPEAEIGLN